MVGVTHEATDNILSEAQIINYRKSVCPVESAYPWTSETSLIDWFDAVDELYSKLRGELNE